MSHPGIKQMIRIILKPSFLISTSKENLRRLIKSKTKHLVRLSSDCEARQHELLHFVSREQKSAILIPLRGNRLCPSGVGRIHTEKENEVGMFRHFKSAKPSAKMKTLGRFSLWCSKIGARGL